MPRTPSQLGRRAAIGIFILIPCGYAAFIFFAASLGGYPQPSDFTGNATLAGIFCLIAFGGAYLFYTAIKDLKSAAPEPYDPNLKPQKASKKILVAISIAACLLSGLAVYKLLAAGNNPSLKNIIVCSLPFLWGVCTLWSTYLKGKINGRN